MHHGLGATGVWYRRASGPQFYVSATSNCAATIAVGDTVVVWAVPLVGGGNYPVVSDDGGNSYTFLQGLAGYSGYNVISIATSPATSVNTSASAHPASAMAVAVFPPSLGNSYQLGHYSQSTSAAASITTTWPNSWAIAGCHTADAAWTGTPPTCTHGVLISSLAYNVGGNQCQPTIVGQAVEPIVSAGATCQFQVAGGLWYDNMAVELIAPGMPYGSSAGSGGDGSYTTLLNIAVGDWVVVFTSPGGAGACTSLTDNGASGGNTYTQITSGVVGNDNGQSWRTHATKAATAITANFSGGQPNENITAIIVPGATGIGNHGEGSGGNTYSSLTTSKNGSWVVGAVELGSGGGGSPSGTVVARNNVGVLMAQGPYPSSGTGVTVSTAGSSWSSAMCVEVTMI